MKHLNNHPITFYYGKDISGYSKESKNRPNRLKPIQLKEYPFYVLYAFLSEHSCLMQSKVLDFLAEAL